jgi:plastocyanin
MLDKCLKLLITSNNYGLRATQVCAIAAIILVPIIAKSQERNLNQRPTDSHRTSDNSRSANTAFSPPSQPKLWEVHIRNSLYNNSLPLTIASGDSVIWVNDDNMQHTATNTEGKAQFDTGYLQPGQRSRAVTFLAETGPAGVTYSCQVHGGMSGQLIVSGPIAAPQEIGLAKEAPSVHSLVVFGHDSIYLYHIALFDDSNHQYEAIFEGALDDPAAQKAYQAYREQYGDELTILDPEYFILGELDTGKRTSFHGTFYRNQWEAPIEGLQGVVVRVKRKILFRHFSPIDAYPPRLRYQVIGSMTETFLVHRIAAAPNFQEIIKLAKAPDFLDAQSIASAPDLFVVDKTIATDDSYALSAAVLSNGTHILLGPPPRTLIPVPPTAEGEQLTVHFANETLNHTVVVEKDVYFDVRILNK